MAIDNRTREEEKRERGAEKKPRFLIAHILRAADFNIIYCNIEYQQWKNFAQIKTEN